MLYIFIKLYFAVRFCNKARALVNDIWSYYKKCEPKFELDKKNLMSTMFINYRAPEILFHYGVLRYSDKLVTRFKNSSKIFNIKLFSTNNKSFNLLNI